MIRYVKDKNNLASFNQWSGGGYSHNTNGLIVYDINPITVTVDNNYSTNGDSCFKIESQGKQWGYTDVVFNDFNIGEKIQASLDILPLQSSCILNIFAVTASENIMVSAVTIPQNSTFQTYSISSIAIPEGTTDVRIRVLQNTANPSVLFMDNIIINKID